MNLIYSNPRFQAWDKDNTFLAYGRLSIYDAGTLDLKTIYDSEGVKLTNPQVLNSVGKVAVNGIYADSGDYKLVYERRNDNGTYTAIDTIDDVPNNDSGVVSGNTGIVDSIVDLRALDVPTEQTTIIVSRYYDDSLNGGGAYVWDSTSTLDDDNGSVIQSGSLPAIGRWLRTFETLDINPYMWGCIPDNTLEDNQTRMTQLFLFGNLNPQYRIILPKGAWYCSGNLTVNSNFKAEHGATIDKASQGNYSFTFGPDAIIDIPLDSLFLDGEGYKYQLIINADATSKNNLVSFSWVAKPRTEVSDNSLSITSFLSTVSNKFDGVVLNKSFLVADNVTIDLDSENLVIEDGGQLECTSPAVIRLPHNLIDNRNDKTVWALNGTIEQQLTGVTMPISVFKRSGEILSSFCNYIQSVPKNTRLLIDADFEYSGTDAIKTNANVEIVPTGGVFSNSSIYTVEFSSPITTDLFWIVPSAVSKISDQSIKMSWFYKESAFESIIEYVLNETVDLQGKSWDVGANDIIIAGDVKLKNGSYTSTGSITVNELGTLSFIDCEIDVASIFVYTNSNDGVSNVVILGTDITSNQLSINYVLNGFIGDFKLINTKFDCNLYFNSDVNPVNATNLLPIFPTSYKRIMSNCTLANNCIFESMAHTQFLHNDFYGDAASWITCESILVQDNSINGTDFIVGGDVQNVGDEWALVNVSFINNVWKDSQGSLLPNQYVEIYNNDSSSVFKGNRNSASPNNGYIANNALEMNAEYIWFVNFGASTWNADDSIVADPYFSETNDGFLCFGSNDGYALRKTMYAMGKFSFRSSDDSGATWSDWQETIGTFGDYILSAPTLVFEQSATVTFDNTIQYYAITYQPNLSGGTAVLNSAPVPPPSNIMFQARFKMCGTIRV